jgi:copper ion binding protein
MKTVTYVVPKIHCDHCLHTVEMEVGELEGVKSVQARLDETDVTVEFDDPANEDQIKAVLIDIDYPPQELTQIQ